jgi:SAM-dependent methyltransferase
MIQLVEPSRLSEPAQTLRCWICGAGGLRLVKPGNLPEVLHPEALRITDANYGLTADIFRCQSCGFLQCPNVPAVLELYEKMSDESYEETRAARARQARALMNTVSRHKQAATLLDVGAGSGILVEEALASGFAARGVEPSSPLQATAAQRGLPVTHGVLPHPELTGPFDVVTLIDVIEHVPDPVDLLRRIKSVMAPDGICLVVTPDVSSVAARAMGWKWWHFRAAHIGYFNKSTLALALETAGLRVNAITRPSWYLPSSYLAERAFSYLPRSFRPTLPSILDRIVVPINLYDSLLAVCGHGPQAASAPTSSKI